MKKSDKIKKEDLWNLDHTISEFILKHLKAFKEMKRFGCPSELKTMEAWDKILDKMIFAFENDLKWGLGKDKFVIQKAEYGYRRVGEKKIVDLLEIEANQPYNMVTIKKEKINTRGWNAHQKKVEEGLRLFWKYRKRLWD